MPNTKTARSACLREFKKAVHYLEKAMECTAAADMAVNHETELFKRALPPFVASLSGDIEFAKAILKEI